jgi:hypothetical protein
MNKETMLPLDLLGGDTRQLWRYEGVGVRPLARSSSTIYSVYANQYPNSEFRVALETTKDIAADKGSAASEPPDNVVLLSASRPR